MSDRLQRNQLTIRIGAFAIITLAVAAGVFGLMAYLSE